MTGQVIALMMDIMPIIRSAAMPRKKHSRRQSAEYHATYLVAIEDWDWSFSFGVNQGRLASGRSILGLLSPAGIWAPVAPYERESPSVKAERPVLYCMLDVHLNHAYRQDDEPNTTGSLMVHNDVLQALLPIPQDALDSLLQMLVGRPAVPLCRPDRR